MSRCRIGVIAPASTPVVEPFSGGLTAHVATLCRHLVERGHDVTLFAAPGSDPSLPVEELDVDRLYLSEAARRDVSMPAEVVVREHHAYLALMLRLGRRNAGFDVIHNHSLHYLPVAMAPIVPVPMLTTLHTPPTPWLESAAQAARASAMRFVAVSAHTAAQWQPVLGPVGVVRNAVDLERWPSGPGGPDLVWSGRIVPEKAPHLAIEAARLAGRPITLAGPVSDAAYFRDRVAPLLGPGVRYAGHLEQRDLARLVGSSAVAVVTPQWDEPYGLVVAEALSCGTPVAAFRRGGIPEIVGPDCARLADPGDVVSLAAAIVEAGGLSRSRVRRHAVRHCSIELMMERYEFLLTEGLAA